MVSDQTFPDLQMFDFWLFPLFSILPSLRAAPTAREAVLIHQRYRSTEQQLTNRIENISV